VEEALEDFTIVADLLGLSSDPLRPETSRATLTVLFDQDAIARHLAEADQAFRFERPLMISKQRARRLLRTFIVATAKIELWLLGYDVTPGGEASFKTPPSFPYKSERFSLYHALVTFWEDCGRSTRQARELALNLSGELFRQMILAAEEAEGAPDPLSAEKLFDTLSGADEKQHLSIWKEIQRIGSRIWDGLRRAWRWLKALILRGIRKTVAWIRNTARLVFRYASNAFRVVKRAFENATKAIRFLLHKTVPGSDPNHLALHRDGDFDYQIFVNRTADPAVVERLLAEFTRQTESFRLTLRVLGALVRAVTSLARRTLFGGWLGFIAALVKLYSCRGIVGDVLRLSRLQEALP